MGALVDIKNIKPGDELPRLVKGPVTRQMLVEWCAAENDYYNLHYDERVADVMKLPGTPIQGTFKFALMGQLVRHWLGPRGRLVKIAARYRGLDLEGSTITACGMVTGCTDNHRGRHIDLSLWIENERGERSTTGEATVLLTPDSDV